MIACMLKKQHKIQMSYELLILLLYEVSTFYISLINTQKMYIYSYSVQLLLVLRSKCKAKYYV